MRYLLLIILLNFNLFTSYSQFNFKTQDSVQISKENAKDTYLNFYTEKIEEKSKNMYFDFSFSPLEDNSIISDSTFEIESVLNYGIGFDYNFDLDNNESIDFILVIDTSITSFSLNFIKFSIIFYF